MHSWKVIGLGMVGSMLGITLLVGLAWYQDIFTIDRDGTVHFRITTDGRIGMPNTPDATALLDLSSTSKGFLMPRMTTAQRDAISSPATGLEIYNTTTNRAERYTGAAWKPVGVSNVGARVYHSAAQSISNTTSTALAFDSERYDSDTIHDTVTNNPRLTAKTTGKYLIFGNIDWVANTTGRRITFIRINGGAGIARMDTGTDPSGNCAHNLCCIYDLAINDYVELVVYQSSGGSLNINASSAVSPEFGMTLLQE